MYQQYYKKDVAILTSIIVLTALVFHFSMAPTRATTTPNKVILQPSATTPKPTPDPKTCPYITPYDKEIESVFGEEACNAKKVLRWTDAQGNVYGENPKFITENADRVQRNGSVDRGLMRINSGTFYSYLARMPELLHNNGIYRWSDMLDVTKNIRMAQIVYLYQGWCAWYASPNDLCSANYPGIQAQ
jgi:hypothetical protein